MEGRVIEDEKVFYDGINCYMPATHFPSRILSCAGRKRKPSIQGHYRGFDGGIWRHEYRFESSGSF